MDNPYDMRHIVGGLEEAPENVKHLYAGIYASTNTPLKHNALAKGVLNYKTLNNITPLIAAITFGNFKAACQLLQWGACFFNSEVNRLRRKRDLVELAVCSINTGRADTLSTLLHSGITIDDLSQRIESPLQSAIQELRHDCWNVCRVLLLAGIDGNATDVSGMNGLHVACFHAGYMVICCLLRYGLNMNQQDHDGNTPLHYLRPNNNSKSIAALIYAGANPYLVNDMGASVIQVYLEEGYTSEALYFASLYNQVQAEAKSNITVH